MNFKKYKEWFTFVFGSEATNIILDDKNECIGRDEKSLIDFQKQSCSSKFIKTKDKYY